MSRNKTKTKKAWRAFLAASSVLVLLTVVSPIAQAAGQGKSGDHGKQADRSTVNSILKDIQSSPVFNGKGKKFVNDGNELKARTNSLLKKLNKLSAGNPAVGVALTSYIGAVDSATATFQSAIKTAKTTYKTALAAATTDAAKQAAEAAYKAAVSAAQQGFQSSIAAANLALKNALTGLLGFQAPAGSPSPSPSSA